MGSVAEMVKAFIQQTGDPGFDSKLALNFAVSSLRDMNGTIIIRPLVVMKLLGAIFVAVRGIV